VLNARVALSLPSPETLLYALLVITALLIAIIVARPSITVSTTEKMLAFVAFCVLPVLCGSKAAPICTPRATPRSSSCF
jgi:short-subunit dehydrogenase involved in D-alanine esterification of teichoic acids